LKSSLQLTISIKQQAAKLGFDACGISKSMVLVQEKKWLDDYLSEKRNADMKYMANQPERRVDPSFHLDDAKSVISVILNYYPRQLQNQACGYKVSKYAYGNDYHQVLKTRLSELAKFVNETSKDVHSKFFIDSAPVMEKAWAQKSGLGWIGKNCILINKNLGSFFFIGEIITNIELDYDSQVTNNCGSCNKCLDACPTKALIAPYQLDASKCIAYATIESKGILGDEFNSNKEWIFGCDICQDICPWNKMPKPTTVQEFKINEFINHAEDKDWEQIQEIDFNSIFRNSSIGRTGYLSLKRNIQKVLKVP